MTLTICKKIIMEELP